MRFVALKEKPRLSVVVDENARMSRFRFVPLSFGTVRDKRRVPQTRPIDAVFTYRDTDMLRIIVVPTGVEHVEFIAADNRSWSFNTLGFLSLLLSSCRCVHSASTLESSASSLALKKTRYLGAADPASVLRSAGQGGGTGKISGPDPGEAYEPERTGSVSAQLFFRVYFGEAVMMIM